MEGFPKQYSKERAQREAAEMQKHITSGEADDYEEAEKLVEQEKAERDKALYGRIYAVDERGMVLSDEERKRRIEAGPDHHNK